MSYSIIIRYSLDSSGFYCVFASTSCWVDIRKANFVFNLKKKTENYFRKSHKKEPLSVITHSNKIISLIEKAELNKYWKNFTKSNSYFTKQTNEQIEKTDKKSILIKI